MGKSVSEIKGDISFDNIASRPILQSNFRNNEFIKFDTRKEITRRIMEMLEDGNIKMIGVHGLPGAGKTTLVTEIARDSLDRRLFNDAIVITVSQTPNLKSIQQELADKLDLKLDKESISGRALLLQTRLKSEEKFLIILDDLWNKELNLKDLGILIESDDQKGIKILLTSRFEPVLRGDFCVEKTFPVELLSENEAWYLFSQIVGDLVKNESDFQQHGNEIVKECARLPIAIVTIAHVLKNSTLHVWKDVLRKLQRSNLNIESMEKKVYSSIRLCYDYVSDEAKLLSLLCCLHEEDASISMENLMRYGIGLGIFEGVSTLQEARDRVYSLVDELKGGCLLLDNDAVVGTVKMHDVIRDVAISIGKERHMYRFRDGAEVEEYKKRKTLEDSWAISLPNGYVGELVCESFEYKQLQLIWMQGENKSLDIISKNFFEKTKEVRVLCFFSQNLKVLPPSLCLLQNLSTLCMNDCQLGDIALIGELKSLEILDLSESSIEELPTQIGQLTRLRILDLRRCQQLVVIHPNILSRLTRLEELMLLNFKNWDKDVEVDNGEIRNASLLELKDLVRLTHLELNIPDIRMLAKDLFSDELKRYRFFIQFDGDNDEGVDADVWDRVSPSRVLAISKSNERIILQEYGLETLLKRCDALYLSELQGLNNIVYELHKMGFPELKIFCLKNNDTIQYLINNMGQITCSSVFGSLELLWLVNLTNLEKICHGELIVESFKRLSCIRVTKCKRLKNLLPFSIVTQLEKIEIIDCEMIEEIFTHEIDDGEIVGEFPHLCFLKLVNLPKLRKFCSKLKKTHALQNQEETLIVDSSMPFFNGKFVSFPKLETLEMTRCDFTKIWDDQFQLSSTSFRNLTQLVVKSCNFMENLFSSAMAASLEQLYSLQIKDCRMMKETMRRTRNMDKMSFPKLNNLSLRNLPNLVSFSSSIFIEFPVLAELDIADCPAFKTFIADSSEQNSCTTMPSLFNEKAAFPSLNRVVIDGMQLAANSFCKLEDVTIRNCKNLMEIIPSGMQRRLRNATHLEIYEGEMVEEVGVRPSMVMELKAFQIDGDHIFDIDYGAKSFPNWGGYGSYSCLVKVDLVCCKSCYCLPPLGQLPSLKKLHIQGFDRVERIGDEFYSTDTLSLSKPFKSLQSLTFSHMLWWKEWSFMKSGVFSDLKQLTLDNCRKLKGMCFPNYLPSLESLLISGCKQEVVASLSTDGLPLLRFLKIGHCKELESFPIRTLPENVDTVKIMGCKELFSLSEDGWPSKLKSLEISYCGKLFGNSLWWNLRTLTSLTSLQIIKIDEVVDSFPEEWQLPTTLKSLTLSHFRNLKSLNGKALQHHTSLQELKIEFCHHLHYLPEEGLPDSLSQLEIFGCGFLNGRCQKERGEDWPKISHIPYIWIDRKEI